LNNTKIFLQRFLIGSWLILIGISLYAQDNADIGYSNYHNTFQIWPSVKINKDFKYGFNINAQYVFRMDLINRIPDGHYFYLSARYKILKYLYADFQFRGVNMTEKNLYRFEFGLKARYQYSGWTFAYRTAYFHENEYYARSYEHGHFPTDYWRNRIEVKYDFRKHWGAYASVEAYTLFNYLGINTRRVAFIAGIEHSFLKMHNINIYYMAQPDFNQHNPNLVQAVAVVYMWDIPKKFKKKKTKIKS
jgi:hypothetical protein